MTLQNSKLYPDHPGSVFNTEIAKRADEDCLMEMIEEALPSLCSGEWFMVKFNREERDQSNRISGYKEVEWTMRAERCREERVVLRPAKDIRLPPEPSFWQRLKNCVRYLFYGRR